MKETIVVLHNIRSVHNVGSIFRTADAAGVKKIYLCGITPSPLDRFGRLRKDFTKVSLGAEKYVAWEKAGRTTRLIDKLRKGGYKIFAIEQSKNSTPYYNYKHNNLWSSQDHSSCEDHRLAVVMGSEVKGLSESILKRADKILEIPMRGRKESLNVAVSFGIVVFHLTHTGL